MKWSARTISAAKCKIFRKCQKKYDLKKKGREKIVSGRRDIIIFRLWA